MRKLMFVFIILLSFAALSWGQLSAPNLIWSPDLVEQNGEWSGFSNEAGAVNVKLNGIWHNIGSGGKIPNSSDIGLDGMYLKLNAENEEQVGIKFNLTEKVSGKESICISYYSDSEAPISFGLGSTRMELPGERYVGNIEYLQLSEQEEITELYLLLSGEWKVHFVLREIGWGESCSEPEPINIFEKFARECEDNGMKWDWEDHTCSPITQADCEADNNLWAADGKCYHVNDFRCRDSQDRPLSCQRTTEGGTCHNIDAEYSWPRKPDYSGYTCEQYITSCLVGGGQLYANAIEPSDGEGLCSANNGVLVPTTLDTVNTAKVPGACLNPKTGKALHCQWNENDCWSVGEIYGEGPCEHEIARCEGVSGLYEDVPAALYAQEGHNKQCGSDLQGTKIGGEVCKDDGREMYCQWADSEFGIANCSPIRSMVISDDVSCAEARAKCENEGGVYVGVAEFGEGANQCVAAGGMLISGKSDAQIACEATAEKVWENGACVTPSNFIAIENILHSQLESFAANGAFVGDTISLAWLTVQLEDSTNIDADIEWSATGATIRDGELIKVVDFTQEGIAIITATIIDGICATPSPVIEPDENCIYTQSWRVSVSNRPPSSSSSSEETSSSSSLEQSSSSSSYNLTGLGNCSLRDNRLVTGNDHVWVNEIYAGYTAILKIWEDGTAVMKPVYGSNVSGEWATGNNFSLYIMNNSGVRTKYIYYVRSDSSITLIPENDIPGVWVYKPAAEVSGASSIVKPTSNYRKPEDIVPAGSIVDMSNPPINGKDSRLIVAQSLSSGQAWVQDNVAAGLGGTHRYRFDYTNDTARFVAWDAGLNTSATISAGKWFTIDNTFLRIVGSNGRHYDYLYNISADGNTHYHISLQGYEVGDFRIFTKMDVSSIPSWIEPTVEPYATTANGGAVPISGACSTDLPSSSSSIGGNSSSSGGFIYVTGIAVSQLDSAASMGVSVGNKVQIGWPVVLPIDATNRNNYIEWNVSGPATIGAAPYMLPEVYEVTFTDLGIATITATIIDGLCQTPSMITEPLEECVYIQHWYVNVSGGGNPPVYYTGKLWEPNTNTNPALQVKVPEVLDCYGLGSNACYTLGGFWFGWNYGDASVELYREGAYQIFGNSTGLVDEYDGSSLIGEDGMRLKFSLAAPLVSYEPTIAGIGFSWKGGNGNTENISGAQGLCLVYEADASGIEVELGWNDSLGFDTWFAQLPATYGFNVINLPWSAFNKEGWDISGKSLEIALTQAQALKIIYRNSEPQQKDVNFTLREIGWLGSCELPSGGSSSSEGTSSSSSGEQSGSVCLTDGQESFCEYDTGCFSIYSPYNSSCDQLINACVQNGSLYTGVSGLNASNNYGTGLKCAQQGGTWAGLGKDPNAVVLGCCKWETSNSCYEVYDPQEANDCNSGGNLFWAGEACSATASNHCPDGGSSSSSTNAISLTELLNNAEIITLPFMKSGELVHLVKGESGIFREDFENYYAVAYKITLNQEDFININSSRNNDGDSYLYVYTKNGNEYAVFTEDDDGGGNLNSRIEREFEVGDYYIVVTDYDSNSHGSYTLNVGVAVAVVTDSLPNGMVGVVYGVPLASTAPALWSVVSDTLPPGLFMMSDTVSSFNYIGGTPTQAGTYVFTVKAENVSGSDTKTFTIMITEGSICEAEGEVWENGECVTPSNFVPITHITNVTQLETAALNGVSVGGRVEIGPMGEWMLGPFNATNRQNSINWTVIGPATIGLPQWLDSSFRVITFTGSGTVIITATVNDGLCNTPSPMTGYDPKCIFTQDWIINIYEGTPPPTYAQVTIGTQTWMKYNLNIETPGSVCYENNASNCEMYGRLYNGNTALTVCPSGWHLPSRTEWEVLTNYAGFEAGRKLKATSGWSQYPGTDNFGFAALPGGYGNNQPSWFNGIVGSDIEIGSWWTDTEFEDKIYSIFVSVPIESGNDYAFELDDKEQSLLSVRCIKNEVVLSPEEQCLITGGTWNDTLCSYFFPIQTITFYQPPSLPSATMVGNTIGYSTGSNLQIQPANATNRYIAWEATGGATIDTLNKKITFNQAGNVTITANIYGGKCQELANPECIFPVGTWTVEVYEPMSGFNLAAVIYDTDPSVNSSFREWGSSVQQTGIAKGIPQQTLLNGKMQFKQGKDGWTEQNFIDAFKPTPGKNVVRSYDMPFAQVKPGWWEFNSNKLCNDGTLDIYGDCSDNDRYVGGFFPPELQTRADADYSQCPNCDKKYTATSWVPLNNTISQFCYDRGRSGTGTTLAECGLEFAEGAFVDGTNPAIWDWGMQYNMSNATKNTFYCFENAPVEFTYKKGQEFFISGQDDIWIYINNKLVIDLGGTHMAAPGYVNLNTLELNEGESYPLNIFFCDRQTSMSNIRIATNINLTGVIPVTGIQISIPDTVNVGDAIPYRNVRVVPENATDKAISWSVSSGVQMDSTVFRFNGEGIATITATVGGYTQTWKVHVMPVFVPVDSIMVTPGLPIEIAYDGTLTLPAVSILPTNATNRAITWVASGATVIENNKVVFDQNVNMATISAVVKGGLANGDFIKTWRIIVNLPPTVEAAPEFIAVSNIRVNIPDTATIENIIQLNAARILPRNSNAAEKNTEIEWHIPGAEIADGIASLANIGKVILTATIPNGLSEGQDYTQSWSIIVVAPPEPEEEEPAVIAVDSIKAFFPKFVTRGDMIYLGLEHAMPINATYRDIKWSFNDEEIYDVNVPIEFLQVGVSEITATILDDMEEEHFTQTWRIAVSAPVTYAVTVIDNESLERSTKRYEVDQRVTIIANSTQRTEFARWRITSKNKIVALDSVELYSPILSFLMPKMDLEIEPIYEHKYAVIINGVNEKLLYTGELVEVTNEPLKAGYKFSYWNVFPIGMIPEEDRKNSTLSFEMPATDIMLRAVLSEEVEARRGEIIDVADIVKESNVGEWLTTSTGKDIIEAVRDENSGAITITANVESEEVVAVETDVPPNATELDSIRIVYTATGSWRLYLDIIGLPYSEGYYVELESLAQPKQDEQEEVRPAPPAVRSFSYSMPSIMSAPEETNVGGITKTFPLSAFKNTLGESIDNNLVRMVSSMSFAPEESGSSTLTITSLASEMKPLDSEVKKACLAEIGMAWDKYAGNDGACKPVAQVNCEGYAENPNGNSWLEGVCKTPIRIICENDPTKEWRGGTCKLKDVYDQDECIDEGYYWTADGKCRTKTELDRDDCTNAGNYWGNDGICRSPVQISCEGANKIWSKGQCKTREEDACERDLGVWKEDGEVCEYSLFVSGRPNVSPNIHITTSGKSIVFANLPTNAEISVYGVRGNVIYAGATGSAAGGTQRIDNVASGAYIIRIRAPGVNYSKVVSIQK